MTYTVLVGTLNPTHSLFFLINMLFFLVCFTVITS